MSKVKNVKELRDDLITVYDDVKKKKIGLKEAKELTNLSGKILNSAKLELEYRSYVGNKEEIEFLQTFNK